MKYEPWATEDLKASVTQEDGTFRYQLDYSGFGYSFLIGYRQPNFITALKDLRDRLNTLIDQYEKNA